MSITVCNFTNVYENQPFMEGLRHSGEATWVYDAGLELWKYYHAQKNSKPDVNFYDIRKHFQGVDAKGHMNVHPGNRQ